MNNAQPYGATSGDSIDEVTTGQATRDEGEQPSGADWVIPALVAQGLSLARTIRSQPLEGLQLAATLRGFWVVTMALLGLVGGLLLATSASRLVAVAGDALNSLTSGSTLLMYMMGGYGENLELSAKWWFGLFFFGAGAAVATFLLRSLAVKLTFRSGGQPQTFGTAAQIVAAASTGYVAIFGLALVLLLIPGGVWARYVLMVAALAVWVWYGLSELLVYIGINRVGGFTKSVLLAHVLFSVAAALVMMLIYRIVISGVVESAIAGLGGM